MTDSLTFFTHPNSRGRIVRWMIEEIGCPYSTEVIDYGPAMKSAAYRAINPMGKVPAIKHGNTVVTETPAICAYLADAFPSANACPATTERTRGAYYRWLFFAAGPLEAAITNQALGVTVPPDKLGMVGYGSQSLVLDTLENALKDREYIVGDCFSAADVYVGSHIGFGLMFKTIPARPTFEAYYRRLSQRPAAVRANALDDALVPKHPVPGQT